MPNHKFAKIAAKVNFAHPECGVMRISDDFRSAHSVSGMLNISAIVALLPCARHTSKILKVPFLKIWRRIRIGYQEADRFIFKSDYVN